MFHTLAELFSIVVAWAIFIVVWNTRHISGNNAMIFVGIVYFFVGSVDLLHTLSYKGMNVFDPKWGANLPTQLWIIGRYMEGISLLVYALVIGQTLRVRFIFLCCFLITMGLLASVFLWPVFPDCYIEGRGLTPFKIISEYIVCLVLGTALFFLYQRRHDQDRSVFRFMAVSIGFTIGAELAFTFYVSVYGLSNIIGHFFKLVSFFFIYMALIRAGLLQPYNTLFRSLKESEEKYQNIFRNAQVGLFRFRRGDGAPVEINTYFSRLMGYSDRDRCLQALRKENNIQLKEAVDNAFSYAPVVKNREVSLTKKDGSSVWVSLSVSFSRDRTFIDGALADISDRKRRGAAQAVQLKLISLTEAHSLRELLRTFLDEVEVLTGSTFGFISFTGAGQEASPLEAWSTNALKRLPDAGPVHHFLSESGIGTVCRVKGEPVVHNGGAALDCKNSLPDLPVIRVIAIPIFRSGNLVAVMGVGNKKTPYTPEEVKVVQAVADSAWEVILGKRAEEALKKNCEEMEQEVAARTRDLEAVAYEFESLFNASQVGMMVLKGGRILHKGNQRLADILGYNGPDEMKGLSVRPFHLSEARFNEFGRKYYNRLNMGELLQVEYELRKKDGSPVWCSLSGKALDSSRPSDLSKGVLWIVDDINRRKETELQLGKTMERLKQSNAELSRFVHVASHDLQEPLRAIVGFLQLLESRYMDQLDEKGRHYIERSVKAGHRMQNLINDLLTLSRIDTRGLPFEPTDLNDIFKKAKKHFNAFIQDRNAVVASARLPTLNVDKNQAYTLFANLISNALKYNESDPPRVEMGLTDHTEDVCFYIRDNGIGINKRFFDRIFIVFQRLHGRDEYSGTGIGLTLCKKIVERHGGRIWVESEEGKGATFFFTLNGERTDQ